MFLLFGWGHQTSRDYGPTLPIKCPNCNNNTFFYLVHRKVWFTLFFIPVFPYESHYYLLCNVCSQGIGLNDSQIDKAKQLNQATLSFLNKCITEEQYKMALDKARLFVETRAEKEGPTLADRLMGRVTKERNKRNRKE